MTNEERTQPYPRRFGFALVHNTTNNIVECKFTKPEIRKALEWRQDADQLHIERVRIVSMIRRELPGEIFTTDKET